MTKSRDCKEKEQSSHDPSRRRFLKGVGIAGAGAAVADRLWIEAEAKEKQASGPQVLAGNVKVALDVNGQKRSVEVEPRTTLLNALRNHLEPAVTGPKLVCDMGTCGACTVLLDGHRVLSCLTLAASVQERAVMTIEGLAQPNGDLHPMQQAFIDQDAFQCGYCTPGQILSAIGCVKEGHASSDAKLRKNPATRLRKEPRNANPAPGPT